MRTRFSKRLIASGLIAAIGANLVATSPAFAGPDRDGNYGRGDSRGKDWRGNDGRGNNSRGNDNRRADDNRGPGRDQSRNQGNGRDHGKPAAVVVQKPVVVQKQVVVKQPVVVQREVVHYKQPVKVVHQPVVVHREVVRPAPGVKVDYHPYPVHYGPPPTRVIVVPERRRYRNVWVVRQYGHRYPGYGRYYVDNDAYPWLAFTAISVALIGALSEAQQRSYEDAQIRAATAPIGQTIVWNDSGAAGSVTAVRDGTSSAGRYCREFQQTVTIGGRSEQAYGTACQQPDGAWEVISQ